MRHIAKGIDPPELVELLKTPGVVYKHALTEVKDAIRRDGFRDQLGLCCYCCGPLPDDLSCRQIEHLEAQKHAPTRTLDWSNLLISCASGRPDVDPRGVLTCDDKKDKASLPISPLDPHCESHFRFARDTGAIVGIGPDARESIRVTNLDCARLRANRFEAMEVAESFLQTLPDAEWTARFLHPLNGRLTPYEPAVRSLTTYNPPLEP